METWKILIITIAGTIAAGIIAGVFIGKFLVKRARTGRRRLLSAKERIVYSVCVVVGAGLILFGVFFKFPSPSTASPDDMIVLDGGMVREGIDGSTNNKTDQPAVEAAEADVAVIVM